MRKPTEYVQINPTNFERKTNKYHKKKLKNICPSDLVRKPTEDVQTNQTNFEQTTNKSQKKN